MAGGGGWGWAPLPSLATTWSVSFLVALAVAEVDTSREPSSVTKKMYRLPCASVGGGQALPTLAVTTTASVTSDPW